MAICYNHDLRFNDELSKKYLLQFYGARVLVCTLPEDIIQLDPRLQEEFRYILQHYRRVGVNCTQQVIWNVEPTGWGIYDKLPLSVHSLNDRFKEFIVPSPNLKAVKKYNSKNSFLKMCLNMGIRTPKTLFYEANQPKPIGAGIKPPVFVKQAVSASGMGIYRCQTYEEVKAAEKLVKGDYQIQEEVKAKVFLNVQYRAGHDGSAVFIATTEQILDGYSHAGNVYPSQYDPRPLTDDVAAMAAKDGIRGFLAFDVAITEDGELVMIECNPRWNGSSYPTIVADRLGVKEWRCVRIKTTARSLKRVNFGDMEYNNQRKTGVIIINWGVIKIGKLDVLIIGNKSEQENYLQRLQLLASGC